MFKYEWSLFVRVAFDTCLVRTDTQLCLLTLKSAMSIVAITAYHCALEHTVMIRLLKLSFYFGVAAYAELRLALFQHFVVCLIRPLFDCRTDKRYRCRLYVCEFLWMRRVTICTPDIVSPMFSATIIIVTFFSGMAREA
jgi:hypothetical protein